MAPRRASVASAASRPGRCSVASAVSAPGSPGSEDSAPVQRRIWVASVTTAIRTAPSAVGFKTATLAEGEEVIEVWSAQPVPGWIQLEPSGFVRADHVQPLAPVEVLPKTPRVRSSVCPPETPARGTGAGAEEEAARELRELRRACEAERQELQRVRADLEECREQRRAMRSKLECCQKVVEQAVCSLDGLYDEGCDADPELAAQRKEAALEAGRAVAQALQGWDEDDNHEESLLKENDLPCAKEVGSDIQDKIVGTPAPDDRQPLQRVPLRAIN